MKVSPAAIYFFDAKSLRSLLVLCLSYRKKRCEFFLDTALIIFCLVVSFLHPSAPYSRINSVHTFTSY